MGAPTEEDTWTPWQARGELRERQAIEERHQLRGIAVVLMVVMLMVWAVLMGGCATELPRCPDAQLQVIESQGVRLYVFDEPNWQRATATYRGLAEGKCRLTRPDERQQEGAPT